MGRYLYGASIQGIQNYIFQTNELKDIIGASELVNEICHKFKAMYGEDSEHRGKMIVHAAGNIKCIFDDEDACRDAVRNFPRFAMEMAPGITISQAVVKIKDDSEYAKKAEELEQRLHAQRNHPVKSLTTGLMAIERSRKTGLPATKVEETKKKVEYLDEGTVAKRDVVKKEEGNLSGQTKDLKDLYDKLTGERIPSKRRPYDISKMTDRNDWIAVIHADGNGLGEVVAELSGDYQRFKDFSDNLDKATIAAAQAAYTATKEKEEDEKANRTLEKLKIRPIVIGGDDLTVICRGDLAVKFVKEYLEAFEKETKERIGKKLTACAGIAFIKSSYPFYYGYNLAEALCGEAKKDAKSDKVKKANGNQAPSCLMFHKVQSSFVEDYAEIKRKELTTSDGGSLCFGPYYLNKESIDKIDKTEDGKRRSRWSIDELIDQRDKLAKEENNRAKTAIRQWLTLMHEDAGAAAQHSKRFTTINQDKPDLKSIYKDATTGIVRIEAKDKNPVDAKDKEPKLYPAYDILSLLTISEQLTKPNQKTK